MSESVTYKRKIVFINPAFQGRFIAWMLGMIVIFGICSALLMYVLLSSDLENETRTAHLRIVDTWQKLGFSIIVSNIVSALFAGGSVVFAVIFISHKIAGPMYRFRNICTEIARGNLDVSSHLRDKDQLQELASAFGEMVDSLKQRERARGDTVAELRQLLVQAREAATDPDQTTKSLDAIEARLNALEGQ
jgi:nitrogen fixation/metabolism regulation signal transduction histidine kinase